MFNLHLTFRVDTFYVSSSTTNCQLTSLEISNILSSDLSKDNDWNIYEKTENCNDNGGGGGSSMNAFLYVILKAIFSSVTW